jgi:hypothetical protein
MKSIKEKLQHQREQLAKAHFAPYAFAALLRGTAKRDARRKRGK